MDIRPTTPEEYQIFGEFCLEKGIDINPGQAGLNNGTRFGDELVKRNQRITRENLEVIYKDIQTTLVHLDPVKAEYDRLAAYFTDAERDAIAAFLNQQGLDIGDHLLSNWNVVAKFLIENKTASTRYVDENTKTFKTYSGKALPVTPENLKYALASIQRSPQGQHLSWKQQQPRRRFDAEAAKREYEAKKGTVERQEGPYFDPASGTMIRPLTGHVKQWRDGNHTDVTKIEPEPQDVDKLYDRKLAELINAVESNLIRDECRQYARKVRFASSSAREAFEEVNSWLERRLHDRRVSGYMG